jgi:hypothetical protein
VGRSPDSERSLRSVEVLVNGPRYRVTGKFNCTKALVARRTTVAWEYHHIGRKYPSFDVIECRDVTI